jgi:hypothetical protein
LITSIHKATELLPHETPESPNHPPFLIYEPNPRLNFALIETINSQRAGVVICIYGDERDHTKDTAKLKMKGKPPKSYMKIAVREECHIPIASDAIRRAFTLKRERILVPRKGKR